jgi:MinD-like ATPase involved in chromosome partitioning or flagellar assembly
MTRVISTHSFRGGTGKSNITANAAVMLAMRGYRVGIVDGDIQSPGVHVIFGLSETTMKRTLNDYLWGKCKIEETIHHVYDHPGSDGSVYLIPSSIKPDDIARILREGYDADDMHNAFRDLISTRSIDLLLIDTHPGLNEETLLSITVSDVLTIVLRPDQQDFQGTSVTVEVARRLRVPEICLVINKIPKFYDLEDIRQKVQQRYQCSVAALFHLSDDIAQNASSEVFILQEPEHPFSHGIGVLVDHLLR